jgi:hypothetical protein
VRSPLSAAIRTQPSESRPTIRVEVNAGWTVVELGTRGDQSRRIVGTHAVVVRRDVIVTAIWMAVVAVLHSAGVPLALLVVLGAIGCVACGVPALGSRRSDGPRRT